MQERSKFSFFMEQYGIAIFSWNLMIHETRQCVIAKLEVNKASKGEIDRYRTSGKENMIMDKFSSLFKGHAIPHIINPAKGGRLSGFKVVEVRDDLVHNILHKLGMERLKNPDGSVEDDLDKMFAKCKEFVNILHEINGELTALRKQTEQEYGKAKSPRRQ